MNASARPRLLPVLMLALLVLAALKTGGAFFSFSSAGAEALPSLAPAIAEGPDAPPSEVERRLLEQLAARRADLEKRASELETREQVLAALERRIEQRLDELKAEEARLTAERDQAAARESEDYAALSSAYERMRARDAAQIFNALEDEILVPVAAGMRTQALSGVLAEMQPDKARALTKLLAAHAPVAAAPPQAEPASAPAVADAPAPQRGPF